MSAAWLEPGTHGVRFFPDVPSAHVAIAEFFTAGDACSDALVLIGRRATFESVATLLASGRFGAPVAAERIHFADAEAALPAIMDGDVLDPARGASLLQGIVAEVRRSHPRGTIRLYGEGVDVLAERGNISAALVLERLCPRLFENDPRLAILCGYAHANFAGTAASHVHAIRAEHTHSDAGEGAAPDDAAPPRESVGAPKGAWVHVIDDDDSVRRSLGRLLRLSGFEVRTFDSGEAFLLELGSLEPGCVVVDIQLTGMSGLDVLAHMKSARPSWPLLAMSGSDDDNAENEALRLGAHAFLKKPLDSGVLIAAVEAALAG
jgi:CheY-like chemotaxis protein